MNTAWENRLLKMYINVLRIEHSDFLNHRRISAWFFVGKADLPSAIRSKAVSARISERRNGTVRAILHGENIRFPRRKGIGLEIEETSRGIPRNPLHRTRGKRIER